GRHSRSVCRIHQYGDARGCGHEFMQKSDPLCRHLAVKKVDTGCIAPRRARLATRPCLTGSSGTPKTIGIVWVAAFAATAVALPIVAITLTWRRISVANNSGS